MGTEDERIEDLADRLDRWLLDRIEEEETGTIFGESYALLLGEGSWPHNGAPRQLLEDIRSRGIDVEGVDVDQMIGIAIRAAKMSPAATPTDPESCFLLDVFPIGEFEVHVSPQDVGLDVAEDSPDWGATKARSRFPFHGNHAVLSSDGTWKAVLFREDIVREIAELRAETQADSLTP